MKTTEEKAKAYDNVVGKLKQFMAQGVDPLITRVDVQDFFPELAESEDEKIRKVLRERIIRYDPNNEILIKEEGISQKQFLDWIEKQGAHANFRNGIQVGDKVTRNEDGMLVNLSQLNRVAKQDNFSIKEVGIYDHKKVLETLMNEQKTTTWSEEDEMMLECVIDKIGDLGTG